MKSSHRFAFPSSVLLVVVVVGARPAARAQVPHFEETSLSFINDVRATDPKVRRAAADGLAKFKTNDEALKALAGMLLQDPEVSVRQAAATSLAKMSQRGRKNLAYAGVCDPDAPTRKGLAGFAKKTKIACDSLEAKLGDPEPLPRTEAQLIATLGHPHPATRLAAARTLDRMRSVKGYQQIWNMTGKDPVYAVRMEAIRIVAKVYGRKILPALKFTLTSDPDVRVRAVAIETLGTIRDPQAVGWIVTSVQVEEAPRVQLAAVTALARIADEKAIQALQTIATSHASEDVRAAAVEILAAFAPRRKDVQPTLARALKSDRSGKVRAAALKAISTDRGGDACAARAERINDPAAEVRLTVVKQLAKCDPKIAKPALENAAKEDKDTAVRKTAVELLIKSGPAAAQETLVTVLQNDREAAIRKLVLGAVLLMPKKVQASALADVVRSDSDADLRKTALRGLTRAAPETAVPALEEVLRRDRDADVRVEAARALSAFSDASAYKALQKAATADASPEVRKIASAGAAKSPAQKAWVDGLLPQTIDTSPSVRMGAVTQLCALQLPRTYRALVRALWADENASVRTAAAKCFADIDHPLVDVGLSVSHETDPDGGVIRTVELSQKPRVERVQKLLEEAAKADPKVRIEAVRGFTPSPIKKVRETLEKLLAKDEDPAVRRAAADAVAAYKDRRALGKLMEVGQSDGDSKTRAMVARTYNALRARWAQARTSLNLTSLVAQLRSSGRAARIAAAQSLGVLRDRKAFDALKEATRDRDPGLREAAVVALATFGDLGAVSAAARSEADAPTKARLIQLNYLRGAPPEKIIASLSSDKSDEVRIAVEAAAIKLVPKAVPFLARTALSHPDPEIRLAAVRTLVLYDVTLAQWAIRVAADNDANAKTREMMWQWAVFVDASAS
jgi:HEAT repeat protein